MITFLGRNELLNAFELLDDELGRMGVEADLFVVGGAAMAVAYDARRATTDVDAVFVPSKEVRTAASRVAEELGLEEDWLNDGVKGFLPGEDAEQVGVYEGTNLHVAAASPKFLLAMKLMALGNLWCHALWGKLEQGGAWRRKGVSQDDRRILEGTNWSVRV